MAWFIVARLLFTAAVVYSAFLLRPLGPPVGANLLFGLGLALLSVVFEWQLRNTAVTHMLGALHRRRRRPAAGQGHQRRAVLGRSRRPARRLPSQLHPAGVPLPRAGDRRPQGRVARAGAADQRCSAPPGPSAITRFSTPRVIIDGRIADLCETGFIDGTLVIPAVRAEGTAARRRLVGLDEAQPRPPRPRHPAEDPEDVRRRGRHLRRRFPGRPRGRPQADRAGADAAAGRSSPTTST